jgi:predicted nucleic acid-binding protein
MKPKLSYSFPAYNRYRSTTLLRRSTLGFEPIWQNAVHRSAPDYFIAAIAKSRGLTVVTHNTKDFGRVDGLMIEDWVN